MKRMALPRRMMKEFIAVGAASLARDVFHDRLDKCARRQFPRRTHTRMGRPRRSQAGHSTDAYYLGIQRPMVAYLIIPFAKSAGIPCCEAVSICDSTKNGKFNNLLTAQLRVGTRLDSHLLRRMRASARVTFVMTSPDQLRSGDQAGIEP